MSISVGFTKNLESQDKKYAIFHIEGGLGKHVASTAIIKLIKENHPDRKLITVAAWPEIFLNNPYIDRVYKIGMTPYFYNDYVEDKDSIFFRHEPYFQTSHILKKTSLIQTWADMFNLKYKTLPDPELYINLVQNRFSNQWVRNKPILVLHTNGGPLFDQKYNYSWTRDMPYKLALSIVDQYKKDYHIIQICRNETQMLPDVEAITTPLQNLQLFALLQVSKKRLLIDSSLQHAAAAFNLPSTVFWIGTSPTVFGYKLHNNIQANPPKNIVKLIDAYLFDYQFSGEAHECPYFDVDEMFDIKQVLKKII
jgi:hypothetical protein